MVARWRGVKNVYLIKANDYGDVVSRLMNAAVSVAVLGVEAQRDQAVHIVHPVPVAIKNQDELEGVGEV